MSKNGANPWLIFQWPVICPTPSQVDILAYSPTMYNRIFTWVEKNQGPELQCPPKVKEDLS